MVSCSICDWVLGDFQWGTWSGSLGAGVQRGKFGGLRQSFSSGVYLSN